MYKSKKLIAAVLGCALVCGGLTACQNANVGNNDGKIKLSVGNWPTESKPADLERSNKFKQELESRNPNIEVVGDTWSYDVSSFLPKASSGQLPTVYATHFTEIKKIIEAGYAADITEQMERNGYTDSLSDAMKNMVSADGKLYAVPDSAYITGLCVNMNLFTQAGLLNADGTPKIPQTYEELVQTAKIIKEKTGKAGFALPTMKNQGGWQFMNLAWSFGTEFMAKENGKWVAKFDSEPCVAALQYFKDLKWDAQVLPDSGLLVLDDLAKLFATDQLAMAFSDPSYFTKVLVSDYKMDRNAIAIGSLPEGPAGRYSLMGGGVFVISPTATPEQIDAAFQWFEVTGNSPKVMENSVAAWESAYEIQNQQGYVVGVKPYTVWGNSEITRKRNEVLERFTNVNKAFFKEYEAFDTVTIRAEEPVNCQELYKVLDDCIQQVLTDKSADPAQVIKKAAADFQANYLDKAQ